MQALMKNRELQVNQWNVVTQDQSEIGIDLKSVRVEQSYTRVPGQVGRGFGWRHKVWHTANFRQPCKVLSEFHIMGDDRAQYC